MKKQRILKEDQPIAVGYEGRDVVVTLANGEVLRNPLRYHPWLANATPEQRRNVAFDALSVWWPDLDEGLDIEGMRRDIPSDPHLRSRYAPDAPPFNPAETRRRLMERITELSPDAVQLIDEFVDFIGKAQEQR